MEVILAVITALTYIVAGSIGVALAIIIIGSAVSVLKDKIKGGDTKEEEK